MNRGFFSALIALLVLSVALSIILGSSIYQKTTNVPVDATLFPQKTYLWSALDQTIAASMDDFESTPPCPVGSLSSTQVTTLNQNVKTKLESFAVSLGMTCQITSPISIRSGEEFDYRYQCTQGTTTFSDRLIERYTFESGPLGCDFQDAFRN